MKNCEFWRIKLVHKAHDSYILSILAFNHYFNNEDNKRRIYIQLCRHQASVLLRTTEFAFIGRSNVGKSSLINMLTNSRKLAKTSVTPGKTQTINHFLINQLMVSGRSSRIWLCECKQKHKSWIRKDDRRLCTETRKSYHVFLY